MPSSSKAQHNFMAAIAHSPAFAKKVGVPQSVGQDFNKADKGRKFKEGGDTMATKMNPGFMAMMAKKKTKRFDGGGLSTLTTPIQSGQTTSSSPLGFGGGGGGGGARGGMDMVGQGRDQIGRSLESIQGALGGDQGFGNRVFGTDHAHATPQQTHTMKRGGAVKKMAKGGMTDKAQDKAMIKKAFKQHDAQEHKGGKGTSLKLAKGGSFRASADGIAQRGKTRAQQFKSGGKC